MSEFENFEREGHKSLVEQLYAAFREENIPALLELLSEDIDWLFHGPTEIPFAGHYHGRGEVARFFATALKTSQFMEFEPTEFLLGNNRVLVQGHERGLAKTTGRVWETAWAHVFTIEGGKITKMREYYDTAVIALAFAQK